MLGHPEDHPADTFSCFIYFILNKKQEEGKNTLAHGEHHQIFGDKQNSLNFPWMFPLLTSSNTSHSSGKGGTGWFASEQAVQLRLIQTSLLTVWITTHSLGKEGSWKIDTP